MDVRWGYNNVRIKEGDEWKAAFRTNRGLFEPLVMFFGLTNSPATFQTMMNDILRVEIDGSHVLVYMDDILIFHYNKEEHQQTVKRVLQILAKHSLFLKAEKCTWEQLQVEYLGMIIKDGIVRMEPAKLLAIKEWPELSKKVEVQMFLGFANFYRRFIQDFGRIARPLSNLMGKKDWTWGTDEKEAFQELKNQFQEEPCITIPNDHGKYRIETNASGFAKGAVLSQEQPNGSYSTIAYMSKAMSPAEMNHAIYDKELGAIMTALDEWRHYLKGSEQPFEIWTDHRNLQYYKVPQKVTPRQAQWFQELSEYNFQIIYKPGKENVRADALSRLPGYDTENPNNLNVTVLPPERFIQAIYTSPDEEIAAYHEELRETPPQESHWENNHLIYKGRIIVPTPVRERILEMHHNSP